MPSSTDTAGYGESKISNTENYPFWALSMDEQDMLNIPIRYNHDKGHSGEIKNT